MAQRKLRYWLNGQHGEPPEHPQLVMGELARTLRFKILGSVPQSMGDQWWFWVEYERQPDWPAYIEEIPWDPVGTH